MADEIAAASECDMRLRPKCLCEEGDVDATPLSVARVMADEGEIKF